MAPYRQSKDAPINIRERMSGPDSVLDGVAKRP